ncbi:hypothetical protein [Candidatus Neoehrlichia procyonis]|uniref:Uncharacterized protein n=1 Tax=Candidatus Neoehrlichia procyonis str. RAC413 TaxID=1359163 RepID=A0A0F3NRF8_9RICK|nr:hypothetical protein [Candidatus Neoehrlichia lotoris]KJV69494.1 hypothetical protein NLO413_0887 [Candidatus Neoehrlichia lotoris str. RAC413]
MGKSFFLASILFILVIFLGFFSKAEDYPNTEDILPYEEDSTFVGYNRFFIPKAMREGTSYEPIIGVLGRGYYHPKGDVCTVGRYQMVTCYKSTFLGFFKRSNKDQLQICACAISNDYMISDYLMFGLPFAGLHFSIKYLYQNLPKLFNEFGGFDFRVRQSYLEHKRVDNMELDEKINNYCIAIMSHKKPGEYACIDTSIRGPEPFCDIIPQKSNIKVMPIAFDKQSFFVPGVHVIIDGQNNTSSEVDIYMKLDKQQSSYKIPFENMEHSIKDVYRRNFSSVCVDYEDSYGVATKCLPMPYLQRPVIKELRDDKVNVMFKECKDYSNDKAGKDTKYCNFEMLVGDKDNNLGFSLIKPKFNIDKYDFNSDFKCEDGSDIKSKKNCKVHRIYEEDANSNVKCLVNVPFFKQKYVVKRDNRYYWLNKLDKILLGYSYDIGQCDESASLDLATMSQDLINKMDVRDSYFYMEQNIHQNEQKPCLNNNMYYVYTNNRAFAGNGLCKESIMISDFLGKKKPACKTRFFSEDNYENFFLKDNEDEENGKISVLNDMMQGMCISNFPSHEYSIKDDKNKYLLNINGDNTKCDFIKIEAWGGGQSGSLDNYAVGRPGGYLMGILKLDNNMEKHLLIEVGKGGNKSEKVGKDTEVRLCDDQFGNNCSIKLIANGGGNEDFLQDNSKGYENLIHYRVATGRSHVGNNEIFIPYQNINLENGVVRMDDKECISKGLEKNPNKYPGAGGCARGDTSSAQEGANGMVKLTCEKWSGAPGNVKKWEDINCGEYFIHLSQIKHQCGERFSLGVDAIIDMLSKSQFCRSSFKGSFKELLGIIKQLSRNIRMIADNEIGPSQDQMSTFISHILSEKLELENGKLMSYIRELVSSCSSEKSMIGRTSPHEGKSQEDQQKHKTTPKEVKKEIRDKKRYDLLDFLNALKHNNRCVDRQKFASVLDSLMKQIPKGVFITRFSIDDHLTMDEQKLFTPSLEVFSNKFPVYLGRLFLLINELANAGVSINESIYVDKVVSFMSETLNNGWDEEFMKLGINLIIFADLFHACTGKLIGDINQQGNMNIQDVINDNSSQQESTNTRNVIYDKDGQQKNMGKNVAYGNNDQQKGINTQDVINDDNGQQKSMSIEDVVSDSVDQKSMKKGAINDSSVRQGDMRTEDVVHDSNQPDDSDQQNMSIEGVVSDSVDQKNMKKYAINDISVQQGDMRTKDVVYDSNQQESMSIQNILYDSSDSQKKMSTKYVINLLQVLKQHNKCRDGEQFVLTLDKVMTKLLKSRFFDLLYVPTPIKDLVLLIKELAIGGNVVNEMIYSQKVSEFVNKVRSNVEDKQVFLDLGLDLEIKPTRFPKHRYTDAYGEVSELEMPSDDVTEIFVNLFTDCVTKEIAAYPYWGTDAHYIHIR